MKTMRAGETNRRGLRELMDRVPDQIDMIEVGESTGALPSMLASVAEFYEDDVSTRMTAAMSLIERWPDWPARIRSIAASPAAPADATRRAVAALTAEIGKKLVA